MDITFLKDYKLYIKVSYVTIIASIITIIISQIIKQILKKKEVITEVKEASEKDEMLSRIGRIVALIVYTIMYIVNEIIINKEIEINKGLITGIISGSALTITIAKGIYTMLHQWSEKKSIYERLEYAEKVKETLQKELEEIKENKVQNQWTLTNKKEK